MAWNASRCARRTGRRCERSGALSERALSEQAGFTCVTLCDLTASSGHGQAEPSAARHEDRFDCRGSSLIASVCHRIALRASPASPPSLFHHAAHRHTQTYTEPGVGPVTVTVATLSPALDRMCSTISSTSVLHQMK